MDWETSYIFTSEADRPEEGREIDWEEAEVHGEKVVPMTDAKRPSAPRAALRHYPIVEGSVLVAAAPPDRSAFDVVDVTDVPSWGVPAKDEAYVDRKGGDDADTVYVYVNPGREGDEIHVQYEYYPSGEPPKLYACGGPVYWTGPEAGSWFVYEGGEVKRGYSASPLREAATSGDGVFAAGPDLYIYSRRRTTVLRDFPAEAKSKEVIGYLAQAWGVDVDYTDSRIFRFAAEGGNNHTIDADEVIGFGSKTRRPAAPIVEVSYAAGRVRSGDGKETVVYRNPYIDSLAHARWVANRLRRRYEHERFIFELRLAGVKDIEPGDMVGFDAGGVERSGVVRKARLDLEARITILELALNEGGGEKKCHGSNTFPAE
ncbi:MAG: hypothetical protein JSW52_10910 [Candidatus Coatesbacteria bacterium]|nr:MAG: hypothetical protein JSW52_10910 [Candidatus Coatesbacteria bacterium]